MPRKKYTFTLTCQFSFEEKVLLFSLELILFYKLIRFDYPLPFYK